MLHRAIVKSGRPIVLSLSPGPTSPGIAAEIQPLAQMWRISDDVWDYWKNPEHFPRSLHDQFELIAGWAPMAHAGSWPDADMLPIGYLGPLPGEGAPRQSRLTHDEQRTMLTLWSIARSPLILGANLTRLDDWTLALITNAEVLDGNQHSHNGRQVTREYDAVVWTAAGEGDTRYLALFNLNDHDKTIIRTYDFCNLPAKSYPSRDLWSHSEIGVEDGIKITLPAHGCMLLKLTRP